MSKYTIRLQEKGRCVVTHALNQSMLTVDVAPEYGGEGKAFSSTDLVAAAVGTCLMTSIDKILERAGHDPRKLEAKVEKILSESPKKIKRVVVSVFYPDPLGDTLIKKLQRAAETCAVKRSLSNTVDVSIQFIDSDQRG